MQGVASPSLQSLIHMLDKYARVLGFAITHIVK
jgi:hypothetical protein